MEMIAGRLSRRCFCGRVIGTGLDLVIELVGLRGGHDAKFGAENGCTGIVLGEGGGTLAAFGEENH